MQHQLARIDRAGGRLTTQVEDYGCAPNKNAQLVLCAALLDEADIAPLARDCGDRGHRDYGRNRLAMRPARANPMHRD